MRFDTDAKAAKFFGLFTDPGRLAVIRYLATKGRSGVTEAGDATGMTMTMASHHLRLMDGLGYVQTEKDGKFVLYRLVDDDSKVQMANGRVIFTGPGGETVKIPLGDGDKEARETKARRKDKDEDGGLFTAPKDRRKAAA